jgi:glutamate synthase domain-containing protein 2
MHDTGEGSISPYHRENGGDLIWEIGLLRLPQRGRHVLRRALRRQRQLPQVKMIELKMSQGAKPGHGGAARK